VKIGSEELRDKTCAPDPRQKKSLASCWNGHSCQWHLHGRCHFRHSESGARLKTVSEDAGPCMTCSDLRDEVRQLRKELQELTKEIRDFRNRELEKDEEVNRILQHLENPQRKKRKKGKPRRRKTETPTEPKKAGETKETQKDPEGELESSEADSYSECSLLSENTKEQRDKWTHITEHSKGKGRQKQNNNEKRSLQLWGRGKKGRGVGRRPRSK